MKRTMTNLAYALDRTVTPTKAPRTVPLDDMMSATILPLRHLLRGARTASRVDGYQICAAVGCGVALHRETLASTLVQLVREHWGRAPVIFHPSAKIASFDEAWLFSLIAAQKAGATDNLAFLLGSRLPRHLHRPMLSLLAGLEF